ncbi:VirK/YbjX family protein [Vibrio fluvialis]|uniref:VirK/YbjX family protein n=1 Tax=Vibrio fluvialis TaxID=676 RepID=UPI00068DF888|nr:VirK/YbjX family protein [Vibrio fluvialis]
MNLLTHSYERILGLLLIADRIYPDSRGFTRIKKNARFCMWGLLNGNAIRTIRSLFSSRELERILDDNSQVFEKPLKPYLCVDWSSKERLHYIEQHFQFMKGWFGDNAPYVFNETGYKLFEFQDSTGACYSLQLDRGENREGSMGLTLRDELGRNIYAISFNISTFPKRVMHIGALQGPSKNVQGRTEIIKTLTRSLFGIRTKALMVELALIVARIFAIEEIYAISNKGHVYQALRYVGSKRKSVTFEYDELWQECGATPYSKYLYQLPIKPLRKDPTTLNKTKRRLYTKRYHWLDDVEVEIRNRLHEIHQ